MRHRRCHEAYPATFRCNIFLPNFVAIGERLTEKHDNTCLSGSQLNAKARRTELIIFLEN